MVASAAWRGVAHPAAAAVLLVAVTASPALSGYESTAPRNTMREEAPAPPAKSAGETKKAKTTTATGKSKDLKWSSPSTGAAAATEASAEPAPFPVDEVTAAEVKPIESKTSTGKSVMRISTAKTSSVVQASAAESATESAREPRPQAARPRSKVQRLDEAAPSTHASSSYQDDGSSLKILRTSHDEPKIDPFADDEPAPRLARTPERARAKQAGLQERSATQDPFADEEPRLEQLPPQRAPDRLPPDEVTQAPQNLPYVCPTPKEYVKKLHDISTNIAAEPGDFPVECGLGDEQFEPRNWQSTLYAWKASSLCHKPLYFEDVELERYGQTCSPLFQPLLSAAKFYLTLPILPYKMGLEPPCECIYPLGYYRPGSCAPFIIPPVPISLRGALLEAGVWVAGVALVP